MDRIRKIFSVIHIGGWAVAFVLVCWVFGSEGHSNWFYKAIAGIVVCIVIFYSHFFVLTRYFNQGKFAKYSGGLLIILFGGPFLFLLAQRRELRDLPTFIDQYSTFLFSAVIFLVFASSVARIIESWFINTFKRETLEKQSIQAELSYLKSQINPHFLFNTLNNIHTLAYKQSPATPEAIMRLSSLMRYMLYDSNSETVAVSKEIAYLYDFINLQQLRYRNASIVDIRIAGKTDSCYVAPLLFIQLLENAYKHAPARLQEGDIKLGISTIGNSLTFEISNPVGMVKKPEFGEVGGIGLANLQKRLQLIYPGKHSLEVKETDTFFKVVLKIHHLSFSNHEREADMLYNR